MSGLDFHGSKQGVRVKLLDELAFANSMNRINVDGLHVKVSSGRKVREVQHGRIRLLLLRVTSTGTEVCNLVHVFPKTIERKLSVHLIKLILPPLDSSRLEEVREHSVTRPHLTNECLRVVMNLQESSCSNTIIVCGVFTSRSLGNTNVENRDEMHVHGGEILNEIGKSVKLTCAVVISKVLIVIHVIDVSPLGVQRNSVIMVLLNTVLNFVDTTVAPFALVPSEGPLRSGNWVSSDGTVIKFGDIVWSVTHQEVEITKTSCSVQVNISETIGFIVFNLPVLSGGEVGVDTEPLSLLVLCHVEWMNTIHVLCGKLSVLNRVGSISRPQGVDTFSQEQIADSPLSETHDTLEVVLVHVNLGRDEVEVLLQYHGLQVIDGGVAILD